MLQSLPGNRAQLRAGDLDELLAAGSDVVLLDVRTAEEIAATGAIDGAVNIPLDRLLEARDEWPAQDASIVVYDSDGYRGNLAMTVLRTFGYRDVRNLERGLTAWIEAGLPVVTD